MHRHLLFLGLQAARSLQSQTPPSPQSPFTAKEAELGKQLTATSLDVRKQITNMRSPAEPFKIMGNLYFVGVAVREYPDDISRNNYINEASVRHTFATFRKVRCRQRAKSNSKKSCRS
jgi:hypothetical protein